jgi:hypothetical protein
MKSFLDLALVFVVLFYGILLILMPLVFKGRFRYRARLFPRILRFEDLPAAAQEFIGNNINSIEVWGFDLVNYVNLGLVARREGPFMALLSNPYTREWAGISYIVPDRNARGYIAFITQSSDGVEVETNTNVIGSVLFPTPNRHIFRFPHVHDVFTLYRLHRMLVQHIAGHGCSVLPPRGRETTELQRRLERYGPSQQARGYMYLDWKNECYRLTWKGAIVAGWRSIWPLPLLHAWLTSRQSKALLRRTARAQQQERLA